MFEIFAAFCIFFSGDCPINDGAEAPAESSGMSYFINAEWIDEVDYQGALPTSP